MKNISTCGENIRKFILSAIEEHPTDISKITARHFGITYQAVNKHLKRLTAESTLLENGQTRNKIYMLAEGYGVDKIIVPVSLEQYKNDKLITRSEAKRLLSRIELFKVVIFDFKGVEFIGQAFADEIFRVFARQHPKIELKFIHANIPVKQMIERARLA